jgi:hypothetical protein
MAIFHVIDGKMLTRMEKPRNNDEDASHAVSGEHSFGGGVSLAFK